MFESAALLLYLPEGVLEGRGCLGHHLKEGATGLGGAGGEEEVGGDGEVGLDGG